MCPTSMPTYNQAAAAAAAAAGKNIVILLVATLVGQSNNCGLKA